MYAFRIAGIPLRSDSFQGFQNPRPFLSGIIFRLRQVPESGQVHRRSVSPMIPVLHKSETGQCPFRIEQADIIRIVTEIVVGQTDIPRFLISISRPQFYYLAIYKRIMSDINIRSPVIRGQRFLLDIRMGIGTFIDPHAHQQSETVQTAQQVVVHRMSLIDETDAASSCNIVADKRIRLHNIVVPMTAHQTTA